MGMTRLSSYVQAPSVQGTTVDVTDTAFATPAAPTDVRPEITIWCDPSELAEIALRKAHRPDEAKAAGELLELAQGDRAVVRQAMEYVVAGDGGAETQGALRLLFDAYQLASKY